MRLRIGRLRRVWVAAGAGVVVAAGLASSSAVAAAPTVPQIYWSNGYNGTIGRADLDGTGADQAFITGGHEQSAVAVDGQHVYWADHANGTIGRANLDGTDVDQDFITGAAGPFGLAVDRQHIYWANDNDGTVGRANLDGTDVDEAFITGADYPGGPAVDGQHIYWANDDGTIGRANLDGSGVDQDFIAGGDGPYAVAVDGQHIYWVNNGDHTIGRANLDGSGVDQDFITTEDFPFEVAVDDQHVYWANDSTSTIGRANLDGSDVDQSFITGANGPEGLAVSVPVAQVSPAMPSAFAATVAGSLSAPQTLTITNQGQRDLSVGGVSFAGQDPGDFSVGSNGCTGSVAPGESCKLSVRFSPSAAGSRTATLDIATNDVANSPLQVPLSGTGQAPPPPPPPPPAATPTTTPVTTTPPPPLTTAPVGGPGATASVPALSDLRVSPRVVHVAGRKVNGECVAQTKKNKTRPACTRNAKLTFAFTLSAPAPVKFRLTGRVPGRKAGSKCVAQTERNARAKRCVRSVTVDGMAARQGNAGANRFTVSRRLAPGTYTLTATPVGGAAKKAIYKVAA